MPNTSGQTIYQQNQEILEYLRSSQLLGNMPDPALAQLLPTADISQRNAGTLLLEEGQTNTVIYFLIRGRIGIYSHDDLVLQMQRRGDIFGEVSALSHQPSKIAVKAETDVNLFSVDTQGLSVFHDTAPGADEQSLLYRFFSTILTDKLALVNFRNRQLMQINQHLESQLLQATQATSVGPPSTDRWEQLRQYIQPQAELGEPLLDLEMLSRLSEPVCHQLIELFLKESQQQLDELHTAFAANDFERVEHALHLLLNGSFGVGANRLVSLCEELQAQCTPTSLGSCEALFTQLSQAHQRTCDGLRIVLGG
jgi:CRP-like cAMP-binding protein